MKNLVSIFLSLAFLFAAPTRAQWAAVLAGRPPAAAGGDIVADLWSPMETISPTAITLKLAASGASNAGADWFVAGSQVTSTSAQQALPLSTINGSATTGTYGYSGHHDTPNYVRIDLNTYPASQSVGFMYQATSISASAYTIPWAQGEGLINADCVVRLRVENNAGTYTAFLTNSGGSSSTITISAATFYWITIKVAQNSTCTLAIYNTSGAQVGSNVTVAGQNKSTFYHFFGCCESNSAAGDDYVDNYVIDKDADVYPLGP